MPLRYFKCPVCDRVKETLKKIIKMPPVCTHGGDDTKPHSCMEEVIKAPNGKFMITANASTGRSKIKDLKGQLTERARNHSRDTLLDETIQINKDNKLGVSNNLLNEKGERRRKIDDI